MYRFVCKKCGAGVWLLPRKTAEGGNVPPRAPTCNNKEKHHHSRGELMVLEEEDT